MEDIGLIDLIQNIVDLVKSEDKIGYLKEETINVTNLKTIIIAARKILESKGFEYKAVRTFLELYQFLHQQKYQQKDQK